MQMSITNQIPIDHRKWRSVVPQRVQKSDKKWHFVSTSRDHQNG